jgi:hypothetical protein
MNRAVVFGGVLFATALIPAAVASKSYSPAYETVTTTTTFTETDPSTGFITAESNCPSGKVPTGGGHDVLKWQNSPSGPIVSDGPTTTGWRVQWWIGGGPFPSPFTATIHVRCANAG